MAKYIVTAPLIVVYNGAIPTRVRYGADVPEYASKEQITQLLDAGLIEKAAPSGPADRPAPTDPAKMNGPQLKAFAAENGIDLGDATKVDDVRAAVIAATTPPPPVEGSDGNSDSEKQE